jgi:hypothetical protein
LCQSLRPANNGNENPGRRRRPGFPSFRSYQAAGHTAGVSGGWDAVQPAPTAAASLSGDGDAVRFAQRIEARSTAVSHSIVLWSRTTILRYIQSALGTGCVVQTGIKKIKIIYNDPGKESENQYGSDPSEDSGPPLPPVVDQHPIHVSPYCPLTDITASAS